MTCAVAAVAKHLRCTSSGAGEMLSRIAGAVEEKPDWAACYERGKLRPAMVRQPAKVHLQR